MQTGVIQAPGSDVYKDTEFCVTCLKNYPEKRCYFPLLSFKFVSPLFTAHDSWVTFTSATCKSFLISTGRTFLSPRVQRDARSELKKEWRT